MMLLQHISIAVRDVLSNTFHDRRICRGVPTEWPPRTPDLNPLWEHLKTLEYAAPIDNEEAVLRIVDAC
jgi:hypothetical protein